MVARTSEALSRLVRATLLYVSIPIAIYSLRILRQSSRFYLSTQIMDSDEYPSYFRLRWIYGFDG